MSFSEQEVEKVWRKRQKAEDDNHGFECIDGRIHAAKLFRSSRKDTNMAWEIDHIFPKEILKELGVPEELINHDLNLRPLHHSNNESKGTLFPNYKKIMCWDEDKQQNVECDISVCIKEKKIKELEELYKKYLGGRSLESFADEYNKHGRLLGR